MSINAFGIDHGAVSKVGHLPVRTSIKVGGGDFGTQATHGPEGAKGEHLSRPFVPKAKRGKFKITDAPRFTQPQKQRAAQVGAGVAVTTAGGVAVQRHVKKGMAGIVDQAASLAGGVKHGLGGGATGFGGSGAKALNAGTKVGQKAKAAGTFTAVNKVPIAVGAVGGAAVGGAIKGATGQPARQGPGW